ncbi:MAG: CotH kinase family protein [Bacteroidales bacterium]|nr:CotH kinase family protein [Bacteroidales bacterium]
MARTGRILALLALLLLGAACRHDEIVEAPDTLKYVLVLGSSITLPQNGSAELSFRIKDEGYPLNIDLGSPACQVRLQMRDGSEPVYFGITALARADEPGLYLATISDKGVETDYSEDACIVIVQRSDLGIESYVSSFFVEIRSEDSGFNTIVRTGLPVVYVDTENGKAVTSKTVEVPAVLQIKGNAAYPGQTAVKCNIRGRGNTTWSWPKKPYLVKLESKTSLLGMPAHKRWVLLANFMDRTLMRNLIAMKVASMTSLDWTPRCVPVELVLNGKHVGSYLLIEQVRVDKNRIPISEEKGYVLECDFHYDNKVQWIDRHGSCWGVSGGIPFGIKHPDPDEITTPQLSYIKSYINGAASAIYGKDFKDPSKGYAAWIDVDSFIDYWIVFEVMGNHELNNPGSVFFHLDAGGKLIAGPCWDFDWGVLSYTANPGAQTGLICKNALWYSRLFEDPEFAAKVKARFNELLPQLQTIPSYIDECEARLRESAELNFQMWDPSQDATMNGGRIINGDERMSYSDAVKRIRKIYQERLKIMSEKL